MVIKTDMSRKQGNSVRASSLLLFLLCAASCGGNDARQTNAASTAPDSSVTVRTEAANKSGDVKQTGETTVTTGEEPNAAAAQDNLITKKGIGRVRLGMTTKQIKQMFPGAVLRVETAPDDAAAIAVKVGGEDLFYLRTHDMDENSVEKLPTENDPVRFLITKNPRYATAEDIHSGSALEDAARAYGEIELNFQPPTEFASFARASVDNFAFWVLPPRGKASAGIYRMAAEEKRNGYYKSSQFYPGSTIAFISISDMNA